MLKSIETMSFEEALSELDNIVKNIESGQENLESAINSFERGVNLKNHCEKKLKEAQLKIEKITKNGEEEIIQEISL